MQRLLCHRVAQYYGLDTSTVDEGEDQGKILARRTHITGMPLVGHCTSLTQVLLPFTLKTLVVQLFVVHAAGEVGRCQVGRFSGSAASGDTSTCADEKSCSCR